MESILKWVRGQDKTSALVVLAFATVIATAIVLWLPGLLPPASPENIWPSVIFPAVFFGGFIVTAVTWGLVAKTSVIPLGNAPLKMMPAGLAVGLVGLATATIYATLAGTIQPAANERNLLLIVLGTLVTLYQSAAEEIYFRGWLQGILSRVFGAWAGVITAAGLFALLHVLAGVVTSPVSFINLVLAGLLFGLLAMRTGGIVASIAAHFSWNWAESILLGLSPNPGADVWGSIFDLDMTGSALWGGSEEGLNASLAVTFVLLALCAPLILWRKPVGSVATAPAE